MRLTTLTAFVIYVVMASEQTTLYLRGLPRQLVREAKAAAARRGSTLAALVSDSLA
jgi:heme exporter protein D